MSAWVAEQRDRIIPEVERSQEELREAIEQLQTVVQRRFDFGRIVAERPLPWVIGGLAIGFWIGRSTAR